MRHQLNVCLHTNQMRRKKFNGSDHLVMPVVMLAEGVHNGSVGPLYYPEKRTIQ